MVLDQFALITCVWIASPTLYSKSCQSSDTALAMLLGPFCDCKPSSLHDQRYQGSQQHNSRLFSQLLLQHLGNLQSPSLQGLWRSTSREKSKLEPTGREERDSSASVWMEGLDKILSLATRAATRVVSCPKMISKWPLPSRCFPGIPTEAGNQRRHERDASRGWGILGQN